MMRGLIVPLAASVLLFAAADAAKHSGQSSATTQHFQLLWLNGKPTCPAGSKLVTNAQGVPSCVAVQTSQKH